MPESSNSNIPPKLAQQLAKIGREFVVTPREEREISEVHLKRIAKTDFKTIEAEAIPLENLPSDAELEDMRVSVEHNPIISHFIPDREMLSKIQQESHYFKGKPSLLDVVFATLTHDISQKFDVTFPPEKEEKALPYGYWEVLRSLQLDVQMELNNYGHNFCYD